MKPTQHSLQHFAGQLLKVLNFIDLNIHRMNPVISALGHLRTSFTPTDTFPNDARYCWRVRVESGHAVGDWSTTWHFRKQWYIQPHLLTPTNLYQNALYPIYSWTPVPGASRYKIEIAEASDN